MIDHLHDLFAHIGTQTVIHTGDGEHDDQHSTINRGGNHSVNISVQGSADDTQRQGCNSQSTADDMGDHIHNFLSPCVIGQGPVG